ncbi:hypothetical protein BXT89_08075 [Halopseudomonas pachastrellae]|uniref:DUF1826 domain-containing protein n=1 Tax=Halopseudomonas pachastrellae TaxID=254161 RepID=A0A1S8DG57_9GAMM|nr:DUF1826 domain-containing protein [Halopseudomonas pachastrellae]ONM44363.1 hypothetical protein BXT89_08075 [Halopseudomonas pachastrellae]SFM10801.1 Protein of unknown function [Halopseudomonas pachastrellae]
MGIQALLSADPAASHVGAHWATGLDLGVLAEVFDEAITIAIMQRELAPQLLASIAAQCAAQPWELAWRGVPDSALEQALTRSMPAPQHAGELIADVRLLAEAVACLFDVDAVGIRMRLLAGAMCPRFHCDNLPVRLVTTYSGPGSEWLPEQALERAGLGNPEPGKPEVVRDAGAIRRLTEGDVCLLKGSGWVGNEERGIVHRSPAVAAGQQRLLLTIDPEF